MKFILENLNLFLYFESIIIVLNLKINYKLNGQWVCCFIELLMEFINVYELEIGKKFELK